jgi:hypothetical protein
MDAICSSETSVETQRTTRRYIPEDDTLHDHRCENLKSYKVRYRKKVFVKIKDYLQLGYRFRLSEFRDYIEAVQHAIHGNNLVVPTVVILMIIFVLQLFHNKAALYIITWCSTFCRTLERDCSSVFIVGTSLVSISSNMSSSYQRFSRKYFLRQNYILNHVLIWMS